MTHGVTALYESITPQTIRVLDPSVAQALLDWLAAQDDEAINDREAINAKRELLLTHVASFDP